MPINGLFYDRKEKIYLTELEEKVVNYEFLKAAINRQMMRCTNKEHYKAGIFISDGGKLETITDIIK